MVKKIEKGERTKRLEDYGDVLTVEDVGKILGIGLNQTYKCLADGTIKSHKIGRKYVIPKLFVQEYLYPGSLDRAVGTESYNGK